MWSHLAPNEYMKKVSNDSKSLGQTFSEQASLPRLPVPQLVTTVQKYLRSVEPLLSKEEFENSKRAAIKFVESDFGKELQRKLELHEKECESKNKSWLEDWWLNFAYHLWADPIIITSNWYAVFRDHPVHIGQDVNYLVRATSLISNILKFKSLLDKGQIPIERVKGNAICMDQYTKIFGTTRIPGEKGDHLVQSASSQHITVFKNDQIFKLQVTDANSVPLKEIQILKSLIEIDNQAEFESEQLPVGIMTAAERPVWSKMRSSLLQRNSETIKEIESSLFCVCLDEASPTTRIEIARRCFHNYNARNRWFDKSFSIIVFKNGRAGINAEHSPLDAPPLAHGLVMFSTYAETEEQYLTILESMYNGIQGVEGSEYKKLKWNLSEEQKKEIVRQSSIVKSFIDKYQLDCLIYDGIGIDFLKKVKLSPDSFLQMAIQLAYYKIYNQVTATYESAQTRKFFHGRTETVRTLSNETKIFVQSMDDPKISKEEKYKLLVKAINHHVAYMTEASNGLGIDRHLLGLYILNLESGKPLAELFTDKAFTLSRTFKLSTSNLTPAASFFGGFGPVTDNGYGVCYALRQTQCWFSISCKSSSNQTDSSIMLKALKDSLDQIKSICLHAQPKL